MRAVHLARALYFFELRAFPSSMQRFPTIVGFGVSMFLLAACGGASNHTSQKEQQALDTAQKQRQELLTKMRAASDAASSCRVSDGDCLLTVSEKREELFEPSAKCESQSDLFDRETCQADLLAKQGNVAEVTEFFQYENWCLAKVVDCTEQLVAERSDAERAAELEARRQALRTASDGVKLTLDIAYARESAGYLRDTVPKGRDTVCVDQPEIVSCRKRAEDAMTKLERELEKDDESYDEKLATELYQSEMTTQAECFQSEYECLSKVVAKYGANRESRRHLKKNLDLIKKMQPLVASLPQPASEECLAAGETEYGGKVEKTYANYSKKPITLFRVFLHQAFAKLHRAQLECLKQHSGQEKLAGVAQR